MNRAYSILEIKSVDEDKRIIEGIATTPAPDRVGDIVEPLGVKFKNPLPLLWQHKSDKPVGLARFDKPTKDGVTFRAELPMVAEAGALKERVDEAWQSIKHKLVRGVSIGFRSIERSFMDDGGIRFIETEVVELSLVTIPANADATIQSIKSIDAEQRAASGRALDDSERPTPPAPGKRFKPVVKAEEAKTMKKTLAEQISAFEATRQAKTARLVELMDAAAEKGVTLDAAEQQEYDTLKDEVASIDAHVARLKDMESMQVRAAAPAAGADPAQATASRAGVRVEAVRANLPKGIPFTRYALALAMGRGNRMEALEIAKSNKAWHDQTPEVETVLKAAVAAGTTTDTTWAAPLVEYQVMTQEFIEYLRPRTIIGRIPNLRRVPFKVKVPRQTAVASVNWVGEGKPKPVGKGAFDSVTLDHTKIAGIIVLTDELVRLSNPSAEALAREDLAGGIIQLMDYDFVDPDKAAVANVSPASITNGVTPVAATGTTYATLKADVKSVLQKFLDANISPEGIVVIMRQETALSLSLMETSLGNPQFPGLSMDGGSFLSLPVVTSQNIPYTEGSPQEGAPIIFAKAPDIMLADDGEVMIDISREASIQMDSAPTDPPTASTVLVSLWQHNMTGIRAERMVNWVKRRAAAVQYISAAKYV